MFLSLSITPLLKHSHHLLLTSLLPLGPIPCFKVPSILKMKKHQNKVTKITVYFKSELLHLCDALAKWLPELPVIDPANPCFKCTNAILEPYRFFKWAGLAEGDAYTHINILTHTVCVHICLHHTYSVYYSCLLYTSPSPRD